ncbi:MAG: class F sortase [Ornithinimicrobium sp.]
MALSLPDLGRRSVATALLTGAVALSAACGTATEAASSVDDAARESGAAAEAEVSAATSEARGDPDSARRGSEAASQRARFQPTELALPGGSTAGVSQVSTVDGELMVPENVNRLGWWDGGAYSGDPFGSTVIAGHIDSAEQGPGYFGQLLSIELGDEITVRGDDATLTYRVSRTALIDKDALVSDSAAFDQSGDHRLVLITCWGRWRPEVSSYDSNFVVFATPIGLAQ